MKSTIDFIIENYPKTIRKNQKDADSLIGLPYSYTVPCVENNFQEMYYWDTYFTNIGLLCSDNIEQAVNNTENVAFLIGKYGKMPNGSRKYFLNRSQPPFFSQMVRDIYDKTKNNDWLSRMYTSLKREYEFWQTKRITSSGLNRYYSDNASFGHEDAEYFCNRCSITMPSEQAEIEEYSKSIMSLCESGWDCTSRFGLYAHNYNPVCLNSLLYGMEKNLSYFSEKLKNGESAFFNDLSEKRRTLMNKYMCDENGVFFDYDFSNRLRSSIFSAASFYPLVFKLSTVEQAKKTVDLLSLIEKAHGVAGCENKSGIMQLQWDYPNGWACLQYMVLVGLLNYGYKEEAKRIAEKYVDLVDVNFEKTGNLWEKYNVVTGDVANTTEYETPTMLGWTAGVYLYAKKILDTDLTNEKNLSF